MISLQRLEALLAAFPKLNVGLLGDLFLDRYLDIDPELEELSIETGLEAYQVTRVRNSPGALGTVMNNLAALGVGRMTPVTVLGDDGQAYDLGQALAAMPVDAGHIVRDPQRMTPTYTKPMKRGADGVWRELNRLDLRNRAKLSGETLDKLLPHVDQAFAESHGLIVVDQVNEDDWGVVTREVREHLAALSRARPEKLVFIDSRTRVAQFDFGVLKPNLAECLASLGRSPGESAEADLATARQAARHLARQTGRPLFCTMGQRGMLAVGFEKHGDELAASDVPGYAVQGPIDTVGAGDSATAGIVASLLAGASPVEAAAVGNLVASVTVQQLGTTGTASPAQLVARWRECHAA
ncbi:MAG TPA: PfkB family carbohydrate kinase [Pirellulales bacterium]|nr:PfkB family carbohydrate kinase [Pirellulales bacterium]